MEKRIAIIGWGSLIWDLENLTPHTVGDWQMTKGPRLPMEFSRISPKRKMGLAVCLDPNVGEICSTHVIRSKRSDLEMAAADLAARERSELGKIGWAHGENGAGRMPEVVDAVRRWCVQQGWHGAVWTDLEPNFFAFQQQEFSVARAITYLKSLQGENLAEAFAYIQNAPVYTVTPLRTALAADSWWRDLKKYQHS